MELKKKDDGYYHVGFQTDNGYRWKNTKATSMDEAKEVCKLAKIEEIESAAKAMNLTQEVLSSIMAGRRVTCESVMIEWVEWLKKNKAPATAQTQTYQVNNFLASGGLLKKMIGRVDDEAIRAFVNADDAGSRANREARLAAVKSFMKFASARTYIVGNPANIVQINHRILTHEQKEPKKRVPFSLEEYRAVMEKATGFYRWATAISYWAGLRLSDVANLEWASILQDEIIVWTKKRDQRVALPLNDPLFGGGELSLIIMEMMETIPKEGRTARMIFPKEAEMVNDPLRKFTFSVYYKRILERLDIDDKSFHCLRHSFATRLDAAGVTIEKIGRFIGHADKATTQGYIHRKD